MLKFCKLKNKDIQLMEQWLTAEHIKPWYEHPKDWLHEIKNRNGEFSWISHFIVKFGNKPIGFVQYYDCYNAKEEWYKIENKGEIFSIDYLIGDTDFLNKGYGKEIVKLVISIIKNIPTSKKIIVQPDNDNIPSCSVLKSNSFIYDEINKYFILNF